MESAAVYDCEPSCGCLWLYLGPFRGCWVSCYAPAAGATGVLVFSLSTGNSVHIHISIAMALPVLQPCFTVLEHGKQFFVTHLIVLHALKHSHAAATCMCSTR